MSRSSDNTSNQRQLQEELETLHKRPDGDDQQDVTVLGYMGIDDVRRPVPGDQESAWLKTPPFESDTARSVRGFVVPLADEIGAGRVFLPPVDVTTRRLLNFWLAWTLPISEVGSGILSILPQGLRDATPNPWYTIAVVDPTLTVNSPSTGFGSRRFYQAELRTTSITMGVSPVLFSTVLTFDVAVYTSFRLGVLSFGAADTFLDVDYSFSS
jgi:hypothetical protein